MRSQRIGHEFESRYLQNKKYSSVGMSVRISRERPWVQPPLLLVLINSQDTGISLFRGNSGVLVLSTSPSIPCIHCLFSVNTITCYFYDKPEVGKANNVQVGDTITVVGICDGSIITVMLTDSKIQ